MSDKVRQTQSEAFGLGQAKLACLLAHLAVHAAPRRGGSCATPAACSGLDVHKPWGMGAGHGARASY